MRIYKDSKTGIFHADYVLNGKRVRPSLGTKNSTVAHLKAGKLINPSEDAYPSCPFENFEAKYFSYISSLLDPNTVSRHKASLASLKEFSKINTLEDITPALLSDLQVHLLSKGLGKQGINRTITCLKSIMHQAEKWELTRPKVWKNVHKLKVPKGRVDYHTPEEIAEILSICSPAWKTVVLLGARAGLRRGEIAVLQWKDIDFKNNQIYVAPNKTEKHRYVPMSADLSDWLLSYKDTAKGSYVVNIGKTDMREGRYFLTAAYSKLTEDLPFDCFMHKLRHTFASHLVQAGVDLYRVSKLLGHSSIQMTEIYAHLAPANLQEAILQLPKI